MDSLKLITSIYQKGLGCNLFSVDEIIHFCDKVIEQIDNPPIEIIEASLMKNEKTDDIESKLYEYHKMGYDEYVVRIILSIIGHRFFSNEIDIVKAVRCSTSILLHSGFWNEQEYYNLYNMEDVYDLAEEGIYGDLKLVTDQFKETICEHMNHYDDFIELKKLIFKS